MEFPPPPGALVNGGSDQPNGNGVGGKARYDSGGAVHAGPRDDDVAASRPANGRPPAADGTGQKGDIRRAGTFRSTGSKGSKRSTRSKAESDGGDGKSVRSRGSMRSTASGYARRRARLAAERQFSWPDPMLYNPRSLCMFKLRNPIRMAAIACIEWKWWDRIVLFLILLNTIQLAVYNPFDLPEYRPDATTRDAFEWIGKGFSIIFAMECVVKILALGMIMGHKTYLSEAWNYLDFFIVIVGILDFLPSNGTADLSSLRSLRVLRPLRAITKFPQLRFLIVLLLQCVPMLSNVLGLCCFIFFVFGILGVQLFAGVLRGSCYSVEDGSNLETTCSMDGGSVTCPDGFVCLTLADNPGRGVINFDSIGGAVVSIFLTMTMEGWAEIMYMIQDAYSEAMFIYFVVLIFVGPIFAIQLFLVVISNKFAQTKESFKGLEVSTVAEGGLEGGIPTDASNAVAPEPAAEAGKPMESPRRTGKDAARRLSRQNSNSSTRTGGETDRKERRKSTVKGAQSGWRGVLWKFKTAAYSETLANIILFVIVLNFFFMAVDHSCDVCLDGYCAIFKGVLEISNIFFAFIFLVEMVIKLVGMGVMKYVGNRMNLFDAFIVVISLIEVPGIITTFTCYIKTDATCLELESCETGSGNLMVLRTFRLVRVVKLLRAFPDVQKQIKIVVSVLGSVAALIALILIFLLIFCILGMNIFGGKIMSEWDPEMVALGAKVYVDLPWDTTPMRYAEVVGMDHMDRQAAPWNVKIMFGEEEGVRVPLGLTENGTIWAADLDKAGAGVPRVVTVVPRLHYDDLLHAAVTTFQVLTISNWNDNLYDAVGSNGSATGLYFYAIIAVGNWMLLNLFIAILIQGFAEQKAIQLQENLLKMQEGLLEKLGGLEEDTLATKIQDLFEQMDSDGSGVIDKFELQTALQELEITLRPKELQDLVRRYDIDGSGTIDFEEFLSMIKELVKRAEVAVHSHKELNDEQIQKAKKLHKRKVAEHEAAHSQDAVPKSFYVFSIDNPFRKLCKYIAENPYWDKFILFCIFVSSVCLAIENPDIAENSPLRAALDVVDLFLNAAFTLEMLFKMVNVTFSEYIKIGWNRLDFLIVTTSCLDMALTYGLRGLDINLTVLKIFRVFRIFRALRPLRIIARARGLRILVTTLMSSVKPVMNTVGIALSVFAIFGVLGMQLMSGKLRRCTDTHVFWRDQCVGKMDDGTPREWVNAPVHFDNIYNAIRALFILATQDDWPDHMWAGVDSTGPKSGPWQNNNHSYIAYYTACILLAGYLIVNIFVGVFVDCYNAAASEMESTKPNEKISKSKLKEIFDDPENRIRLKICDTVATSSFDLFIAFFICGNVITMAMESWKQSMWQTDFGNFANFLFTFVFGVECIFKMWAFAPRRYYVDRWNRFDFFIVMISFFGVAIDNLGAAIGINPTVLRVLRIFRVFRILRAFRIFKAAKGLQDIIATLVDSLPAIVNLFSMLALLFFIYGVLGVTLYGNLCVDGEQALPGLKPVRCMFTDPGNLLDPHANFNGVGWALLTLFRVSTGDAWGDLLTNTQLGPGSRDVEEVTYTNFKNLYGADPAALPSTHPDYVAKDDPAAALKLATVAMREWNASAYGLDDSLDWPEPTERAAQWIVMGRQLLPGCLNEDEAIYMEDMGVMDCGVDGYNLSCASSCGDSITANLFFVSFVCMATFVLLQLVIAVLMEQLANNDSDVVPKKLVPGCENLTQSVFSRLYRRWRHNAAKKLRYEKMLQKLKNSQLVPPDIPHSGSPFLNGTFDGLTQEGLCNPVPPMVDEARPEMLQPTAEEEEPTRPSGARTSVVASRTSVVASPGARDDGGSELVEGLGVETRASAVGSEQRSEGAARSSGGLQRSPTGGSAESEGRILHRMGAATTPGIKGEEQSTPSGGLGEGGARVGSPTVVAQTPAGVVSSTVVEEVRKEGREGRVGRDGPDGVETDKKPHIQEWLQKMKTAGAGQRSIKNFAAESGLAGPSLRLGGEPASTSEFAAEEEIASREAPPKTPLHLGSESPGARPITREGSVASSSSLAGIDRPPSEGEDALSAGSQVVADRHAAMASPRADTADYMAVPGVSALGGAAFPLDGEDASPGFGGEDDGEEIVCTKGA